MRYYATAFLRETEENRELMQAYMAITANILALLDGDTLDDRSMVTGREEIIQRYIEQARSDPYEPGNCSFCGERPVAAWFEGPSFRSSSAARLKYGQRRRGWRARRASRSWRRTIAAASPDGVQTRGKVLERDDGDDGPRDAE
jgi:hypothetical protein